MSTTFNLKALGTDNWRAYALFRAGLRCAASSDHDSAEELYLGALREDHEFDAPRVNFGGALMIDRQEGTDLAFAREQFLVVLQKFEHCGDGFCSNPVFFSALYQLASATYDMDEPEEALGYATRLIEEINEALRLVKDKRIGTYLAQVAPAARALLIGMRIERGLASEAELREIDNRGTPSSQFHYNYACGLVALARRSADRDKRTALFEEATRRLNTAFRLNRTIEARARKDRSLAEWWLWKTGTDYEEVGANPS